MTIGALTLLFARRRWADRVIERAGFPTRSPEGKILGELLTGASRKNAKELPTSEQVLFAALRMFHNGADVARVAKTLSVSSAEAESALAKLPSAAVAIATERRMGQFVDVANRIHFS
jgi:hypothetical protein